MHINRQQSQLMDNYPDLFQQLYQQKYYRGQKPKNSIDRVRLLQKKISQSKSSRKINKEKYNISINDQLLMNQNYLENPSSRIVRYCQSNKSERKNKKAFSKPNISTFQRNKTAGNNPLTNETFRKKSQSQRNSCFNGNYPTQLYHSKKYSLVKHQYTNEFTIDLKEKNKNNRQVNPQISMRKSELSSLNNGSGFEKSQRSQTPSKQVFIGGHNLEQEAQKFRRKMRLELELNNRTYRRQLYLSNKRKQINNEKNQNANKILKDQIKVNFGQRPKKKYKKDSKNNDNEEVELLPWALVPDYQFY